MGTETTKTAYKKRSCLARAAALMGVVVLVVAASVPGGGVDDDAIFELEGNVVEDTAPGPDWVTVIGGGGITSFVTDPAGQGDNILTGGHTKDVYDFGEWLWKQTATSSVQDKDDIIHAAATVATLTNGHTAIYFMADRFSNSGDSQMGFWFVQDSNVAINNNASGAASGGFNGHHTDGDFLIVAHFVTGGATPEIEVFRWSGGANGFLAGPIVATNTNKCDPATGNKTLCAIVNAGDGATALSGFLDKTGSTTYGHGEFMEGGIDLQATFGDNVPCVSTFFAETRSSQSTTATLSDFTAPVPFPLCHMSINKNCTGASINSDGSTFTYSFSGTVTNDGLGSLYNINVTDTAPGNVIGSVSLTQPSLPDTCTVSGVNYACLQKGHTTTYGGSYVTSSIGGKNHVDATAGSQPGGSGVTASADWPLDSQGQPTCKPNITKGLTLTKQCAACLQQTSGKLFVHIGVTGNVCNTGNTDLDGVTVTDNKGGTILSGVHLEPGGCQNFPAGFGYDPSTVSSGTCTFEDTVSATGNIPAGAGGGTVNAAPQLATCALCVSNSCTP